jgi:tetratricopeptide (TPR) repeat protein
MWMQADVLARYFRLLGWPVGLSVRHHVPVPVSFLEPRTVLSVVAILGVLVLFAAAGRRAPLVAFGIGWFFAALAPVMNVVPLPGAMMGERFCYVPMIGALVALVEGLRRTLPTRGRPRALAAGAGAALMAALAVTTFVRTRDWRDNVTLFEAAARVAPESNAVRINLIREYELRGRPDLARLHWEAAAANTRAYAARYEAIAVRAEAAGERDEAVAWYLRVLRLIPDEPRAVAGLRRLGSGR